MLPETTSNRTKLSNVEVILYTEVITIEVLCDICTILYCIWSDLAENNFIFGT
jgi:hypothetical protein